MNLTFCERPDATASPRARANKHLWESPHSSRARDGWGGGGGSVRVGCMYATVGDHVYVYCMCNV